MMSRALALIVLFAGPAVAWAQVPIQWNSNPGAAVAQARRTGLPLMFYVPGSRDNDSGDLVQGQQRTFRDKRVREFAQTYFIPTRMVRSSTNIPTLEKLNAPTNYGFYIVFATPEGDSLGMADPATAASTDALLQRMSQVLKQYRNKLYSEKLRKVLAGPRYDVGDARRALNAVQKLFISSADQDLARMLKSENLPQALEFEVMKTLAALSSPTAVKALVEHAKPNPHTGIVDRRTQRVLQSVTPAGAKEMLPLLRAGDDAQRELIYEAAAKVVKLERPKNSLFWKNAGQAEIDEELQRLEERTRQVAERWTEEYGLIR